MLSPNGRAHTLYVRHYILHVCVLLFVVFGEASAQTITPPPAHLPRLLWDTLGAGERLHVDRAVEIPASEGRTGGKRLPRSRSI
jgi:hypothetical protein